MDARYVGSTVTFRTAEKAPERFDAWTFFWRGLPLDDFEADLTYVVRLVRVLQEERRRHDPVGPAIQNRRSHPGLSAGEKRETFYLLGA